jgi:uncharacterized protein YdeI (YjbR/CyaY-like superfamily)
MSDPLKFTSASQWRHWLTRHHDKEKEIWVAFAKKGSGKKSITYDEALDEALCFGWVDNLKKRLDNDYYLFRFVPRKRGSKWSQVNLDKFAALEKAGRMTDAGRAAKPESVQPPPRRFQTDDEIPDFIARELALHPVAREFWDEIPPSHRRNYVRWITEAKRDETRAKRLDRTIAALNARQKQFNM